MGPEKLTIVFNASAGQNRIMTHTWQQLAYIHGLGAELPSHVFNPDKQVYHSRKPVKLVLPPHFIHEIETIGYKVIGVNVFLGKKRFNFIPIILLWARYIQVSIDSFIRLHCSLKVNFLHIKLFTYYIYILVRTCVILKFP